MIRFIIGWFAGIVAACLIHYTLSIFDQPRADAIIVACGIGAVIGIIAYRIAQRIEVN